MGDFESPGTAIKAVQIFADETESLKNNVPKVESVTTNWVNLNRLKRIGLNNDLLLLLVIKTK